MPNGVHVVPAAVLQLEVRQEYSYRHEGEGCINLEPWSSFDATLETYYT